MKIQLGVDTCLCPLFLLVPNLMCTVHSQCITDLASSRWLPWKRAPLYRVLLKSTFKKWLPCHMTTWSSSFHDCRALHRGMKTLCLHFKSEVVKIREFFKTYQYFQWSSFAIEILTYPVAVAMGKQGSFLFFFFWKWKWQCFDKEQWCHHYMGKPCNMLLKLD